MRINSLLPMQGKTSYQHIAHILTWANNDKMETSRLRCRQVFQTMHRQINEVIRESMLNLGDEYPIAANLCQWHIAHPVALGSNLLNGYRKIGPVVPQPLDYPVCLYHRQLAGACPYRYLFHLYILPNRINSVTLQSRYAPDHQPPPL